MKMLGGLFYNLSKKIFAKRMMEDESLKNQNDVKDIFGAKVTAVQLLTYPPATTGLLVLKPEDIISRHENILKKLRRYSELPERQHDKTIATFETIYYDVIINYIKFVHLVPASESHHHTDPGGLLRHSLQVSEKALKHVEQEILKQEFPLDIERTRKARWFYATWICGLLHDVSKVFTDLKVVDMAAGCIWNPNECGLVDWALKNNVRRYRVEFVNGRTNHGHDSIKGSGALEQILTPAAKAYLWESPDNVYEEMRKTLVSYQSVRGYISNAVRAADSASTSKDMITIWDNELGPKTAALYQRIIKAMRILSKQWDSNTHNAKVQIVSGRVYIRYPEAFQDISKFLSDEGVSAPSSTDAMVAVLDERGLIYRPKNQSKYVMIANGEFTPELIIENIKNESRSIKSGMYLPLEWPAMIYDKDPVPPSVVCYVKINREHDYEIHKKDGEMEEYNFESLSAIDDSIKPLLVDDGKTDSNLSGGLLPVDDTEIKNLQGKKTKSSTEAPEVKPKTKKTKKQPAKTADKKDNDKEIISFQHAPIENNLDDNTKQVSVFSMDQQSSDKAIGFNVNQGLHAPSENKQDGFAATTNTKVDTPTVTQHSEKPNANNLAAVMKQRNNKQYPWIIEGEPEGPVDKEIIAMTNKYKLGDLSDEIKECFYHFPEGYIGIASKVIRDIIDAKGISMSEFIMRADNQGLISKSKGQKNTLSKFKIGPDKESVGVLLFNQDVSKFIIEQTGLAVNNKLPSLKGR